MHLDPAEPVLFHVERQQGVRHGARVGRVEIEVAGEDGQALGIGRFDAPARRRAASRDAASRIMSGRRSGGRCSTTCELKMPSSEASGRSAR